MSSHILGQWALEPQQFNMKFEHTQGKKNMVADVILRLRMYGLYQDTNGEEVQLSLEDAVKNILEEIHNIDSGPTTTAYTKTDKLNLDLLQKEQWQDSFCKRKLKEIKVKPDPGFILDENSILRKAVKLRYSVVSIIVVPGKLTNTDGSRLSRIFWEHENLSSLSIIWLNQLL